MSKANNLTDFLTDVANVIRYKTNVSVNINPQSFANMIRNIESNVVFYPSSSPDYYLSDGDMFDFAGNHLCYNDSSDDMVLTAERDNSKITIPQDSLVYIMHVSGLSSTRYYMAVFKIFSRTDALEVAPVIIDPGTSTTDWNYMLSTSSSNTSAQLLIWEL